MLAVGIVQLIVMIVVTRMVAVMVVTVLLMFVGFGVVVQEGVVAAWTKHESRKVTHPRGLKNPARSWLDVTPSGARGL